MGYLHRLLGSIRATVTRERMQYAAFGVVATLLGVAAGHLAASLLNPDSSPVLAVGSAVIDLTPHTLKDYAIERFGTNDKPILIGSVFAGVLVLVAVAGLITRRHRRVGPALIAALAGVAAVAVLTRPVVEAADVVPVAVTLVVACAALWWLDRLARSAPPGKPIVHPDDVAGPADSGAPAGTPRAHRRTVLLTTAAVTAAAAALGATGRLINTLRAAPEDITLPEPIDTPGPVPRGLEGRIPGITPWVTPNADFYRVDTRLDTPVVSSKDWTLTIDGNVDHELVLTFDELLSLPTVERDITLTCVSNAVGGHYVGAARWQGVLLKDLLARAGVRSGSDQLVATDFDGMTIGSPLEVVTDGRDALVAIGMNGVQLPREHGFPARIVVPGLFGFVSATKWVTRLTVTSYADTETYWTKRKWATDAPVKPSARIDTPRSLAEVDRGEVIVGGVAWAQDDRGVSKVQVQVDGGPWVDAELGPDLGSVYWRQWYYRWSATASGQHNLRARVIDGEGDAQVAVRAEPFPSGASGLHSVFVTVR